MSHLLDELLRILRPITMSENEFRIVLHPLFVLSTPPPWESTFDDWMGVEIVTRNRLSDQIKQRCVDAFVNCVPVDQGALGFEEVRFVDDNGIDRRTKLIWNALQEI